MKRKYYSAEQVVKSLRETDAKIARKTILENFSLKRVLEKEKKTYEGL